MTINTLSNGLSVGPFGQLKAPKPSPNLYKPPVSINRIDAAIRNVSSVESLQFPEDLPEHYLLLNVFDYSRASTWQLGNLNFVNAMRLPIPLSLTDSNQVSYKDTEIGMGLGLLANHTRVGEVVQNLMQSQAGMANKLKSLADLAKNTSLPEGALGEAGKAAGGKILTEGLSAADNAVGANLSGLAQVLGGYSPNQFLTILLQGPTYKRYRFEWLLSPKNEQESISLKDMVRYLNNYMAPGLALGGGIFTFPKVFKPAIMPNSRYMYKFKPSVLESMTINYTGGGQAAFFRQSANLGDGGSPPESLQLSLSFLELEFWLTGDYKDTNDPFDTIGPRTSGTGTGTGADAPRTAANAPAVAPTTTPAPTQRRTFRGTLVP